MSYFIRQVRAKNPSLALILGTKRLKGNFRNTITSRAGRLLARTISLSGHPCKQQPHSTCLIRSCYFGSSTSSSPGNHRGHHVNFISHPLATDVILTSRKGVLNQRSGRVQALNKHPLI
ncbi:hypothetical protein J6590_032380 [Homalodisca vitripennis]|nr:hypothetical protein J6590_032380 [Homalodisca vitripennis]